MLQFDVRPAVNADARGIAHVHVRAWREAYAEQLPADLLAGLREEPRAERWATIIDDDRTIVFVAVTGDRIVGWATSSLGRDIDAPVGREVEGIYVLREFYGSGAGQALLESVARDEPAYLWMLDDNPRAEAFYAKNGFIRDGEGKEEVFSGASVHVVRLVRH